MAYLYYLVSEHTSSNENLSIFALLLFLARLNGLSALMGGRYCNTLHWLVIVYLHSMGYGIYIEDKARYLSPFFKASALWADAFYKSKCPSVCPSVCLCVCSLLRYPLTVFLPPLPEVGCPIFLEIRNPWGKVMERNGLRYENFSLKIV